MFKEWQQLDRLVKPTLKIQPNYTLINGVTSFYSSKVNHAPNRNQTNSKHSFIKSKKCGTSLHQFFKPNDSELYDWRQQTNLLQSNENIIY
jgi:hypothetical protein